MAELYPVDNDYPDPFEIPPANRVVNPGTQTLFRQSTGFEKALADTDAERLMDTYAEAIVDIWNPWQVAYEHLPFLAWAQGVNLWEDWWDETMRRSWTARQWYLKSIRGKRAGLDEFVTAVGGHVKRCIVPPARAYGTKAVTDAERAAYVARFPQLRIYPYVAREQLPWLCFNGVHWDGTGLKRVWNKNGEFLGPRWKMYPTVQDAGGKYTRTAALYEPRTGVETKLTIRRIAKIRTGETAGWGFTPGVSQYDESVILPLEHRPAYYCSEPRKYLGFNIYLGIELPLRTISLSRSGPLPLTQAKAQYQTTFPQEELLQIRPEYVSIPHLRRKTELYACKGEYLIRAKSIVTHEIAGNLIVGSPVFGRALFGMHANPFVLGHPTFSAPVLTVYGAVDPATMTWVGNVQAIGGSVSPTRINLVNNLIVGLRADNLWAKLDRLWLIAAENQQSARVDIKVGITPAVAVNSPTFTADRGYAGNGSNAYVDTNWNPTTQGTNYVLNSACVFGWSNTDGDDPGPLFGIGSAQNCTRMFPLLAGQTYWGVNDNGVSHLDVVGVSAKGLWSANRSGATAEQLYRNGVSVAAFTAGSILPNENLLVLHEFTYYTSRQVSCFGVSGNLNATEQTNLYARLLAYMSAVGVVIAPAFISAMTLTVNSPTLGAPTLGGRVSPDNMTSNVSPVPYVASAQSEYPTGFEAFRSFNSVDHWFWGGAGGLPQWIQIDLGSAKAASRYTMQSRTDSVNHQPTAWTLEGSNNGTTWTTADTRSGIAGVAAGAQVGNFTMATPGTYRYWRWTFTTTLTGVSADCGNLGLYS